MRFINKYFSGESFNFGKAIESSKCGSNKFKVCKKAIRYPKYCRCIKLEGGRVGFKHMITGNYIYINLKLNWCVVSNGNEFTLLI